MLRQLAGKAWQLSDAGTGLGLVKRNRVKPSPTVIDRQWPHQVALPDDICTERNFTMIARFCEKMGAAPQIRHVQAVWPDGKYEEWRLHCFANQADAKAFLDRFGGIMFDPAKDRENGRAMGVWRRTGEYQRILELGPLSVPEILRY
ncbi:hypothetical protein [Mesorhizobium sp. B4-1-4]|uniref:hypothetical protein n=1 Tax=Mesorhizobium sp. B4-1-4 TaxID=2589888 RepID=UPI001127B8B9|nr:hypothetical protein [Mesorhizobium sp. B4-1-4]UCI32870.1 hypothetical protein FJW03_05320 [Mesorhizobium sp. B4-1-4]